MLTVADPVGHIWLRRPASHGRRSTDEALDVGSEAG